MQDLPVLHRTFRTVSALLLLNACALAAPNPKQYLVYVGTYTNGSSKGIYAYRLNPATGELTSLGLEAETTNPSYLAADRKGQFLYAVNEIGEFEGKKAGSVSAFRIDRTTGKLTFLNVVSSEGADPCHLMLDKTGRTLLVANYSGGSVAALPVGAGGKLGAAAGFDQHSGTGTNPARQDGPHAHCANVSQNNKFAVVADLGLDKLFVYRLDPASARLTANPPAAVSLAPGSGPRHFDFHPNGRFGYSINEMKSTVTAFTYDGKVGGLKELETVSTLPAGFAGENTTAELFVHPGGRFLYGSNRGHDSIAVFAIGGDGKLTPVEHVPTQGVTPRGFAIDPSGRYLIAVNQKSENLVMFKIDAASGKLTPTGTNLKVGTPVSVTFVKSL